MSEDEIDDAFKRLRSDIARKVSPRNVTEIARRARRRRAGQQVAAGSAMLVVIGCGVGLWATRTTPSAQSPVLPAAPATSWTPSPSPAASSPASAIPAVPAPVPSAPASNATVSTITLPVGYWFDGLVQQHGQLLVTGSTASSDSSAPCVRAALDTGGSEVGAPSTVNCGDPVLHGQPVTAMMTGNPATGKGAVSVARSDPATGKVITGPTVMTYVDASDTRPVVAYGGGSMWVYDVATENGPEAIQVSATGTVLDVVKMPQLVEPVLAADADGLWLGNSIEGSQSVAALFHIAVGAHATTTVMTATGTVVDWLVADDGRLWAGVRDRGDVQQTLWRFDGSQPTAVFHALEPGLMATSVVGSEAAGLWTAIPDANTSLQVLRIDPDTGTSTVEASLPALPKALAAVGIAPNQAALFNGDFYLLGPPFRSDDRGYSTLARVTPNRG